MSDETPENGDAVDTPEDQVPEQVDLTTMTEEQLLARRTELTERIEALDAQPLTPTLAVEINALREDRNAVTHAVNEIRSFTPVDDVDVVTPEPEKAPEDTTTDTPEEPPVSDTTPPSPEPADNGVDDAVLAAAEQVVNGEAAELAVTASASRPTAPARQKQRVAYIAAAGDRAHAQGMELDWDGLQRAFDSRARISAPEGGGQVRAVIASLPAFEDTKDGLGVDMLTQDNTRRTNDDLISTTVEAWSEIRRARLAGQEPLARVAAICEPLDIIRDIPQCGETDTPFTNLFPQRPIGRLGFQFTRASTAAATDGAINEWAQEDQDAIDEGDPSTWKPCIPIECASPVDVTAEELVTCVSVDISTEMSSPERVKDFMHKLKVQRARRREQIQLTRWDATASGFNATAPNGYGTIPALVKAVETLMPQLAYTERLDETDWDIVFEPGMVQKVTIDRHGVCNPSDMAEARSETMSWLRGYLGRPLVFLRDFKGANPYQTLPAAGTEEDLEELPATDRIRLVPAGAYIYGSTGEEATGWQTDPQLVRQNRKQAFTMEWFLLAKHGCHPAAYIDLTSTPDGGRGGCVTPYGYVEPTS